VLTVSSPPRADLAAVHRQGGGGAQASGGSQGGRPRGDRDRSRAEFGVHRAALKRVTGRRQDTVVPPSVPVPDREKVPTVSLNVSIPSVPLLHRYGAGIEPVGGA